MYLANGGYWRQRIPIIIRNDTDRPAAVEPVPVRIGKGKGEADLVGARAEAVRVCDAAGTEMLFDLTAPNGQRIVQGNIPAGSVLTIPAECAARRTATCFVYFDNPSAWRVPDFLDAAVGLHNGGVEEGTGNTPFGWQHDANDEQHRTFWVTEHPHSGKRCLKTVVADGAETTWIATRQLNIRVTGGARYVLRAWVKAENVKGYVGWYVHVGNEKDPMLLNRVFNAGGGSYDWKEIVAEFAAPPEANVASLGTVLWGSGAAWFDDVSLTCLDTLPRLMAQAGRVERFQLQEVGADAKWFDDNPNDDLTWDCRAPIKVMNFSRQTAKTLVYVDAATLIARGGGKLNKDSLRLTDGERLLPCYRLGDGWLFEAQIPPRTVRTFYAYQSFDPRLKATPTLSYADLLNSGRNLAKNPSFERGENLPE